MTHKTINELEALREKSLNQMPENIRVLYSYSMQRLTMPININERQYIPYELLNAVLAAEKGDYQLLEDQRQELINYSMGL